MFEWAKEHKRLRQNPFAEIKADVPRKVETREEGRSFTDAEVRMVLNASLATLSRPPRPIGRAGGWLGYVPTRGARPSEITQLGASDIEARDGLYVMRLTPEAGTVKTRKARVVPLHEHLIAQDLLAVVKQVGAGALFYNDTPPQAASAGPFKPARSDGRGPMGSWRPGAAKHSKWIGNYIRGRGHSLRHANFQAGPRLKESLEPVGLESKRAVLHLPIPQLPPRRISRLVPRRVEQCRADRRPASPQARHSSSAVAAV